MSEGRSFVYSICGMILDCHDLVLFVVDIKQKSLMFYHMVCKEHLRYLYNRFRIRLLISFARRFRSKFIFWKNAAKFRHLAILY